MPCATLSPAARQAGLGLVLSTMALAAQSVSVSRTVPHVAANYSGGAGTWSQLGKTQQRENVQAISMDYSRDGFPVFAYGWDDPSLGNGTPPAPARRTRDCGLGCG